MTGVSALEEAQEVTGSVVTDVEEGAEVVRDRGVSGEDEGRWARTRGGRQWGGGKGRGEWSRGEEGAESLLDPQLRCLPLLPSMALPVLSLLVQPAVLSGGDADVRPQPMTDHVVSEQATGAKELAVEGQEGGGGGDEWAGGAGGGVRGAEWRGRGGQLRPHREVSIVHSRGSKVSSAAAQLQRSSEEGGGHETWRTSDGQLHAMRRTLCLTDGGGLCPENDLATALRQRLYEDSDEVSLRGGASHNAALPCAVSLIHQPPTPPSLPMRLLDVARLSDGGGG